MIDGNVLPSINSKKAPPPVEQYDTSSGLIYLLIADKVSPPPANEKASDFEIAFERHLVPSAKRSFSNTPTGPFQRIVFASFI